MPDQISTESDTKPIGTDDANDRITPPPPINPIAEGIQRIADYSERQREKHAPTIIDLTNSKVGYVTHQRHRIIEFIFSCASADHVSITFGSRVFDFLLGIGVTTVPFAYEADRGVDIVFANVTSADHLTYCYIIAYTE